MNLSKKEFAELVRSNPDASDDEILALAKEASDRKGPGALKKAWDWANKPLLDLPDPENPVGRFAVNMAEGLTSPLGLGLTALSAGGGLAAKAGLLGVSRALHGADAAANAAFLGEGAHNVIRGLASGEPGAAGAGALQAGLAGVGLRGSMRRYQALPRVPRSTASATSSASTRPGQMPAVAPQDPPLFFDEELDQIFKGTHEYGGQTWSAKWGDQAGRDRFSVVIYPERELHIPAGQPFNTKVLKEYVERNRNLLSNARNHLGTWKVKPEEAGRFNEGDIVLDISTTTPDLFTARQLAKKYEQDSIFDLLGFNGYRIHKGPRVGQYTTPIEQRLAEIPNDVPTLTLEHRTPVLGLTKLDPNAYGTGPVFGRERSRKQFPNWVNRSFATVKGEAFEDTFRTLPVYEAEISQGRIYDWSRDPEGFFNQARQMLPNKGTPEITNLAETLIRDAGYEGYYHPTHEDRRLRGAVVLFGRKSGDSYEGLPLKFREKPQMPTIPEDFDPYVKDNLQMRWQKGEDITLAIEREKKRMELVAQDRARTGGGPPYGPINIHGKPFTAMSVAAPAAGMAIEDDPDSVWDNVARVGLVGGGILGMVRGFPSRLGKRLAKEEARLRTLYKVDETGKPMVDFKTGEPLKYRDSEIETRLRQMLVNEGMSGEGASAIVTAFKEVPLPTYNGIDFNKRYPITKLLTKNKKTGRVEFAPLAKKRVLAAFEAAGDIGPSGWENADWLYTLSGGDPDLAVQIARIMAIMSSRNRSGINAIQGLEAAARYLEHGDPNLKNLVRAPRYPRKQTERAIPVWETNEPLHGFKVENMARGTAGWTKAMPPDMWVARMMGVADPMLTPAQMHHVYQAMKSLADETQVELFPFMAQAWNGIQKLTYDAFPDLGQLSLSYRDAIQKGLGGELGSLKDPTYRKWVLENIDNVYQRIAAGGDAVELTPLFPPPDLMPTLGLGEWTRAINEMFRGQPLANLGGRKAWPQFEQMKGKGVTPAAALKEYKNLQKARKATRTSKAA